VVLEATSYQGGGRPPSAETLLKGKNMNRDLLLDLRSQERYTRNGDMKKLADENKRPQTLAQVVESLSDLSDQTVPTVETQPALGLFDAETLERVQKSFPYHTFK
jgi:hypothetical protein